MGMEEFLLKEQKMAGAHQRGREENRPKMHFLSFFFVNLRAKRHGNKIMKVQLLLSSNFVVIAQAPS